MSRRSKPGLAMRYFVQDRTELTNVVSVQFRIVADIESKKMHMVHFRIPCGGRLSEDFFEIGLSQLVATSGCTSPEFHPMTAQYIHYTVAQLDVGAAKHKRECIIGAALQSKVRLIPRRIQIV